MFAAGIPERTLKRAKAELRAESHPAHAAGGREWYDPAAAWPASAPFRRPAGLPPLADL